MTSTEPTHSGLCFSVANSICWSHTGQTVMVVESAGSVVGLVCMYTCGWV